MLQNKDTDPNSQERLAALRTGQELLPDISPLYASRIAGWVNCDQGDATTETGKLRLRKVNQFMASAVYVAVVED